MTSMKLSPTERCITWFKELALQLALAVAITVAISLLVSGLVRAIGWVIDGFAAS